jgi:hypothetical protein
VKGQAAAVLRRVRRSRADRETSMVLVVRVAFPSNPKEFVMIMSFAFAIATMIAVLSCQTLLKLVNGPVPLRSRWPSQRRRKPC